jgi:hypothetical protein
MSAHTHSLILLCPDTLNIKDRLHDTELNFVAVKILNFKKEIPLKMRKLMKYHIFHMFYINIVLYLYYIYI